MNQKSIVLTVVLFALLVVGMFMYAHLHRSNSAVEVQPPLPAAETPSDSVPYPDITRITTTHYYIDGVHTFVGELNMPTPCDLLEVESVVMESYPEQIRLDFNVINNAEMCAQVITPQRFQVSATASSEATVTATFMGRDIELNIIPAPEGETPEDFEVFIKG